MEADFREYTKRRMLKSDAVPSVFPLYPAYMKKDPPKERSCSSIQKRKLVSSTDALESLPSSKTDLRPALVPEVHANRSEEVSVPSCSWQQPDSASSSNIQDLLSLASDSEYCQFANFFETTKAYPAGEGTGARALRSVGAQADSRSSASTFLERNKWRDKSMEPTK